MRNVRTSRVATVCLFVGPVLSGVPASAGDGDPTQMPGLTNPAPSLGARMQSTDSVRAVLWPGVPEQYGTNRARLGFSFNKARGVTGEEWTALVQHADMAMGLDGHGYDFPGYLDDFRAVRPDVPVYCFATAMALQRVGNNDWRFKYLDHYEEAFLHVGDPASLKVAIIAGETRLFWIRDHRKDPSASYPNPIGVTSYQIESAVAKSGPWTPEGGAIPEDGTVYYQATLPSADPQRWYRLRTLLADSSTYTDFSWPIQPDPEVAGFAYLKVLGDLTFVAGMWGAGPADPAAVVLQFGQAGTWGYPNTATSKGPTIRGITEYVGRVTNYPTSGAWVMRLRDQWQGWTSMIFEPSRRNNRLLDTYGAHFFKPDHNKSLTIHKGRLADARALGLAGIRLDFVIDSYPSWLSAWVPAGEDAPYLDIKPHMITMLSELKYSFPEMKIIINGISVPAHYTGIYDYLPYADGADCEYIGWSSPSSKEPFRDADMLDGAIGVAHVRGKKVTCYSYAAADNIDARITSFARYWLVFTPDVYYHYMTLDNHQSVDYFPEYDIDLGPPDIPVLASRHDLLKGGVYQRAYRRGIALYNPGTAPTIVNLDVPLYVVQLHGTRSPKQNGTGYFEFLGPVRALQLAGKRGALLVRAEGDLNCDGAVNFGDIKPFVLALSDPEEYKRQLPTCNINLADCNQDQKVDFGDINPFVELLSGAR